MAECSKIVVAGLAAAMFGCAAIASTPAMALFRLGAAPVPYRLSTAADDAVIYDFPPDYVGYLCVTRRPAFDQWGQIVGHQNVVVPC